MSESYNDIDKVAMFKKTIIWNLCLLRNLVKRHFYHSRQLHVQI